MTSPMTKTGHMTMTTIKCLLRHSKKGRGVDVYIFTNLPTQARSGFI